MSTSLAADADSARGVADGARDIAAVQLGPELLLADLDLQRLDLLGVAQEPAFALDFDAVAERPGQLCWPAP